MLSFLVLSNQAVRSEQFSIIYIYIYIFFFFYILTLFRGIEGHHSTSSVVAAGTVPFG